MSITMAELRRRAVTQTLFPLTHLPAAVERLGFVQADPMCAPARAQDLILRHRVADYRAGDLERQYPALDLVEDYLHLYGFMPAATLAQIHPRTGKWRVEQEYPALAEQVLAFVADRGEADARAVDAHFGAPTTLGHWGTPAKATTMVLEMLHYRGLLRVARRQGNQRWFRALPPVAPAGEPRQRLERLVLLLARLHAPVVKKTLKQVVAWLRRIAPEVPERGKVVEQMIQSGQLAQAKVDGVTYLWPAGEGCEGEALPVVRLLAPFDPVVWDRDRFLHLWGWPYRLEAYTPPPKRRFGRYALPLLWGDQVIGWANLTWQKGQLTHELGFAGERPADPAFGRELAAELDRMITFLKGR